MAVHGHAPRSVEGHVRRRVGEHLRRPPGSRAARGLGGPTPPRRGAGTAGTDPRGRAAGLQLPRGLAGGTRRARGLPGAGGERGGGPASGPGGGRGVALGGLVHLPGHRDVDAVAAQPVVGAADSAAAGRPGPVPRGARKLTLAARPQLTRRNWVARGGRSGLPWRTWTCTGWTPRPSSPPTWRARLRCWTLPGRSTARTACRRPCRP